MNELGLIIKSNKVVVSSTDLASRFEKEHYLVLRTIENLIQGLRNQADDYFIVSSYKDDSGKNNKMYLMNRDGFTLAAMSFTGKKALKFKTDYIKAFNSMESILREKQSAEWKYSRLKGKKARKDETDVIMTKLIPHAELQGSKNTGKFYMNYSKLINSTLGIQSGQRDNLPLPYIDAIRFLERAIENIISIEVEKGTHYKEIYQVCKAKCNIIKDLAFLPSLDLLVA